ncbi:mediator of DNA damage checkpoint protein 1 [Cocos nucifera]|uniref:Mediator of DNA damage checkpoint protein 1 n=1 Tax=Cocos nucifera TaxID=13894 RepID=A0A8K0MTW3_COCNU|nr:mediator of DNA damage checkpoint protein 1 [Cocos nucifera]
MVFAGDHEETQVLDTNSPPLPGVRSDDETDDGGYDDHDDDDGVSPDQGIMLMGDTLPIESLREVPDLYGETQALDDLDNGAGDGDGGVDAWVKTQLVDSGDEGAETKANDWGKTPLVDSGDERMDTNDWGKTQLVDSGDEGTEMTEVLSGDEGLSDDGATPCVDQRKTGGMELEMKKRVNGDGLCSDEQGHEIGLVDSDASTDEDDGAGSLSFTLTFHTFASSHIGSSRRTFTAVRIASLRSSGLAAARKFDSKTSGAESKSLLSNGQCSKEQNGALGGQAGDMATGRDLWPNSIKVLTSPGTEAVELDLDHEIENSHGCMQDCNKNGIHTRAKKLFYEVTPSEEDETTVKTDNIVGKGDLPHSLPTDSALAGLSYVESQEPGDLSQANALEVVDKFLSVNFMESSQEANTRKATDMVKSPPISSTKGAQCLAEKTDHRSPVGKAGIFDWIDSLEDEGGGEFFTRRKDSFFKSKSSSRKSQSRPQKARHPISEITRGVFDKSGEECANPDGRKVTMLAHSDSRLMMHNSTTSKAICISETKTKKSLFKDMDEQSNPKPLEQHPEATDVEGGIEVFYNVGPDTQMAAEGIEALVHAPPVDYVMEENQHVASEHLNENSSKGPSRKMTSSKKEFLQKRVSVTDLEGTITRSKHRRMLHTKSRRGESPSFSRENSSRSRMKKCSDDKSMKTKSKREVWNREVQLNATSLVNGNASSRSLKREKIQGAMDGIFIKQADKCHSPLTSDGQPSVQKEFTPGECHDNATPVAHRTRHSKRLNLSKDTEVSSSEYRKDISELTRGIIPGFTERQDMLVLDASGPLDARKGSVDMGPDQTASVERTSTLHTTMQNIERLQEDELENSSISKDAPNHPKWRTGQTTSGNPNMTSNLNESSIPDDCLPATNKQSCKQQGRKRVFIRSVSEILDAAKRKRRSVFTRITYQADGGPSVPGELSLVSGVRTRSSSSKPYSEKESKGCLSRPVSHGACSADAANNCSSGIMSAGEHPKEAALPKQGVCSTPCVEDAEEHAKPEGTPKEQIRQSGLACKSPSKNVDAVSPVCVAQDPPRTCNKGLSKSLFLRELHRLKATEAASTPALKDLRRRKDMGSVRVLFSHHLDEDIIKQQKKILGRLGVPIASSISDATHFVADKFFRTRNMLEAIASGTPVVTYLWLESCGQASCFIDEKNYILRDAMKEKEIGFSMPVSLAHACQSPLLQGKRVFITANVKPTRELIASLVKAAHGQPMERIGRSAMKEDKVPDDLLVISCEEDYSICIPLLEKGAGVFGSELLLNGIVIQKLEYERNTKTKCNRKRMTREMQQNEN